MIVRAMWSGTTTATQLGLGNDFFDRKPGYITAPGATFLRNSEHLYGLWFYSMTNFFHWQMEDAQLSIGKPDEDGFKSFQARAAFGALRITSYWLTVILCTLIEAYLTDVLVLIASRDASFAKQLAGIKAKARSVPSDRQRVRAWLKAHKNPKEWLQGLNEIGVTDFTDGLSSRLHDLLGVRHLVVHSAGVVDEEYLHHHPRSTWQLGSTAIIDDEMLRGFIRATFEFVAPIEAYMIPRFVSQSRPDGRRS
jgi:hypothetical protein